VKTVTGLDEIFTALFGLVGDLLNISEQAFFICFGTVSGWLELGQAQMRLVLT
jgi:hypothetical protein